MSNSSLVNYVCLSPNRNSPRQNKIDTITIHCMAGNLSIETCGNLFSRSSTQASSNYSVGSDGRIGMYVEESNRSWCTSSPYNDHRAVTIEVANDGGAPDYHVSSKAMASLIKLVADICKRNGIKKLVWSDDKNTRMNHLNGCNMTVHRDYAAKSCPGDYLYRNQGYIASEVNKILNGQEFVTGVAYRAHCQKKGWGDWVANGTVAGTQGQGLRLEALQVKMNNISGNIWTEVHVQKKGWITPVKNGATAGTIGESLRIEAIKIALEGQAAKDYDVWYRCHCQTYGWLGWTCNGQISGTTGLSKRVEAVQIMLVKKGQKGPSPQDNPYIQK